MKEDTFPTDGPNNLITGHIEVKAYTSRELQKRVVSLELEGLKEAMMEEYDAQRAKHFSED